MSTSLDGKVAIVTGGGSGIGLATAQYLAKNGASVVIVDFDETAAKDASQSIDRSLHFKCDVGLPKDVEDAVGFAVENFGGLDIMVNNAGVVQRGSAPITEVPTDELERVLRVNVGGVFNGIKYAAPRIAERGGGSIISTASAAGLRGCAGVATYAASKAAVISLTQTASLELLQSNIRVNAVCPGNVRTPIWGDTKFEEFAGPLDEMTNARQGRWGVPEDVAGVIVTLASDEMSFVSGQAIAVDNSSSANLF